MKNKRLVLGFSLLLSMGSKSWGQQLSSLDMEKVKEAIPYAALSDAVYQHKVEDDGKQGVRVEKWARIESTRASFREVYNKSATSALVDTLSKDGSLSADDLRQIQQNDAKLDASVDTAFIPKDPVSFHAEAYKNENGKIAIVFEGTGSLEDWGADFAHARKVPDQYKKALEFTKKVIEGCGNTPGCNTDDIIVTGHSLGGGLAQYVAMSVEANVKAYTFNPAGLWDSTAKSIDTGKAANITNFVADGYGYSDVVSKTGVVFGKKIPVSVNAISPVSIHSISGLKDSMVALVGPQKVALANTGLLQNQLTAITQGGSSHIYSASLFTGHAKSTSAVIDPTITNSLKAPTGVELAGYATNTQAFQASAWQVVTGTAQTHLTEGTSFGPISASNGSQITALNNANVQYTHIIKEFQVPVGVKQVTLTLNGNFVTNEYPTFVGSQYNDYGVVKLISPSGNATQVTAFKEVLNSSNFQNVAGLPSPMMAEGGQTGFKSSTATVPVANGGKVIVDVEVHNVSDTLFPSAVLLNAVQLK